MTTFLNIILVLSLLATVVTLAGVFERMVRERPKPRWMIALKVSGSALIVSALLLALIANFFGGLVVTLVVVIIGYGVYLILRRRPEISTTVPPPAGQVNDTSGMVRIPGLWGWALREYVTPEEVQRIQADREEERVEKVRVRAVRKEQRRVNQDRARLERSATRERGPLIPLSAQEALNSASSYMTRKGFTIESRSDASVTFSNRKKPSDGIGCLLLLLGIVPGVLYFALAGRQVRSTLAVIPEGAHCRAQIGGESDPGYRHLRKWCGSLPGFAGPSAEYTVHEDARQELTAPKVDSNATIPEQIHQLAELRDSGLLSDKEFEAKKSDLLRRM